MPAPEPAVTVISVRLEPTQALSTRKKAVASNFRARLEMGISTKELATKKRSPAPGRADQSVPNSGEELEGHLSLMGRRAGKEEPR